MLEIEDTSVPNQEQLRLQALDRYELLDTSNEQELDQLTELAALLCGAPIALISLVASDRQWFKSKVGLDITQTKRSTSFCQHVVQEVGLFEVMDATIDTRFQTNPLVTDNPNVRFYAGVPLLTPQGHVLGTLCVIDTEARILTYEQRIGLEFLARQVMAHFELRKSKKARKEEQQQLAQVQAKLQGLQAQMELQLQAPLNHALEGLNNVECQASKDKVKDKVVCLAKATKEMNQQIQQLLNLNVFIN